ncbi:MAG: hypothetical protein RLZZ09_1624 [Pseudomonadota bacterium]|jgi:hypothetical protein
MDFICVIVATLAAAGAAAGLKPTVEQAIKNAYAALKWLIVGKYNGASASLGQLEQALDS